MNNNNDYSSGSNTNSSSSPEVKAKKPRAVTEKSQAWKKLQNNARENLTYRTGKKAGLAQVVALAKARKNGKSNAEIEKMIVGSFSNIIAKGTAKRTTALQAARNKTAKKNAKSKAKANAKSKPKSKSTMNNATMKKTIEKLQKELAALKLK